MMDYSYQLERLEMLLKAMEFIVDQLAEHPVEYEPAKIAYNTVIFGIIPTIKVDCPHDPDCCVSTPVPCGGLSDALDCIEEAIDLLGLEMMLENCPTLIDGAEYDI